MNTENNGIQFVDKVAVGVHWMGKQTRPWIWTCISEQTMMNLLFVTHQDVCRVLGTHVYQNIQGWLIYCRFPLSKYIRGPWLELQRRLGSSIDMNNLFYILYVPEWNSGYLLVFGQFFHDSVCDKKTKQLLRWPRFRSASLHWKKRIGTLASEDALFGYIAIELQ